MGARVSAEKGLGSRPLPPGADLKLAKGLAGGGRDPGRKGGAQPAGGAVSPKSDWNWDLPLGGDTKSCPKEEEGKEEEEGEKKGRKRKKREIHRQIFWATGPSNKHMLCLGGMLNA